MSKILNWLGNCSYRLNGGLDALHNNSILDRLSIWFWSESYGFADEQCKRMKPILLRWIK